MQRLIIGLLGLVAVITMSACVNENQGWPWAESRDGHVFKSTQMSPKSVLIHDLVTRQVVYRIDIPVGHTCKIKFETDESRTHSLEVVPTQKRMRYVFFDYASPSDMPVKIAGEEKVVPLANAVRMEVIIRDTPDIPEPTVPSLIEPSGQQAPPATAPAPVAPQPQPAPATQPDAPASELEKALEG